MRVKLTRADRIRVLNSDDVLVELISLGTMKQSVVDPTEVFSRPPTIRPTWYMRSVMSTSRRSMINLKGSIQRPAERQRCQAKIEMSYFRRAPFFGSPFLGTQEK